jgi:amino acid transporter
MGCEAKNPKKNLPRAVIGVLAIVTELYVLTSLALVGMQNYLREYCPVLSPIYPPMSILHLSLIPLRRMHPNSYRSECGLQCRL